MRDINRIRPLLNRLATAWETSPDLRLGQIVHNVAHKFNQAADPFYIEDETLIRAIEKYMAEGVTMKNWEE